MIADTVLPGRLPRIGTISTGYGKAATSQKGSEYSQPNRAKTLVLHTNDADAAAAAVAEFGGAVLEDSPTWAYDVVTAVREFRVWVMMSGFRQHLELWRAGSCERRCDGVTMSMVAGNRETGPCLCADQPERACSPTTVLPVLLDLDLDRVATWEVRSTGWGTAANVKGTMQSLSGASGMVPCILGMKDRDTRDRSGQVRAVTDMTLIPALSLAALTAGPRQIEAPATDAELVAGADRDDERVGLLAEWAQLRPMIDDGLRDVLADDWRKAGFDTGAIEELTTGQLRGWLDTVRARLPSA